MKIELPRKDWYTVEELAHEWEAEVNDITHLFESGKLVPAYMMKSSTEAKTWIYWFPTLANAKKDAELFPVYDVFWWRDESKINMQIERLVYMVSDGSEYGRVEDSEYQVSGPYIKLAEVERFERQCRLKNSDLGSVETEQLPPVDCTGSDNLEKQEKVDCNEQLLTTTKARPPQLDHKGKPRNVGKLFKGALQEFYKDKGKACEDLEDLVEMIKMHKSEKQAKLKHPYLKELTSFGENEKDYICVNKHWFKRRDAQRNFREQVRTAVYPSK